MIKSGVNNKVDMFSNVVKSNSTNHKYKISLK